MFNQHRILRVFKLITLLKTFPAKSIKRLAQSLEISERSCYRYLDLLAKMGFEVDKDPHHKFYLRSESISEPFTKEESQLIHEALSVAAKNNPLAVSIQAKLPYLEESQTRANQVIAGHIGKLVYQIQEAITNQKQVRIFKYQSASSESISDRIIEPIGFTDNYQTLCGFEVESHQNKYFKLERMGSLEILEENCRFKVAHQLLKPDVFGFNETAERFHIQLKLSMRAMLFLKDDYPATAPFLNEQIDGTWLLSVEVNSKEPAERILRGMPGEVEINYL
ncbi:helix-turn-helix transcriptional regulator [Aquirufa regiilacus]|uniref:WYL domain-containing protein n=1 Tax=Aquirufa regiilacus TaxID=3024868 RepID=A0ABU3TSX6_9BACT|nr:WYL domain-containing protein [Aquirufa sp. LEOWEIH-7C]MDU0808963.1 WYL domain-containing protein [Aquirufa sp. LEOWEIH-7C]